MTASPAERGPFLRTALILWTLGLIGAALVLPYALELEAPLLSKITAHGPPLAQLLAMSLAQSAVLLAVAVASGLWAARKLGLRLPIVEAWASGRRAPPVLGATVAAVAAGAIASAIIIALDRYVFVSAAAPALTGAAQPAAWKGLLASFYGAIDEEILVRLGVLSLLALALQATLTRGRPRSRPLSVAAFWTANLLAAVLFGLGHLPATAAAGVPLTGLVVLRAIVLNGLAGLVFGALFRRFGLEFAMLAHFSADLVLHVATPLLS